jgi:O-antigen ligase/polysaccharide polymerase Wzy-like membrane protein
VKSRVTVPWTFAAAAIGFVSLSAISYWSRPLAIGTVVTWSVLVIMWKPPIGWALTIFAVPFQSLFAMANEDFFRIRAVLILVLTVRLCGLLMRRETYRSPMPWLLVAFALLVSIHDVSSGSNWKQLTWDTLFFLALGAVYLIAREFGSQASGMALAQTAMVLSALICGAFSLVFLFVPLPDLIIFHQSLVGLRLFGVQDNPNALALILVPPLLFLVCAPIFTPRRGPATIPLLLASAFLLAATETRSAFVAIGTTLFLFLPLLNLPDVKRSRYRFVALPAIVLLASATWLIGVAPFLERHAARQWIARQEWSLCYYLTGSFDPIRCERELGTTRSATPLAADAIFGSMMRDLRLEGSYAMIRVDGKTEYVRRAFNPREVGQRDRTWRAGFNVVAQHWLWGIGNNLQWSRYMNRLLGYPFSSPHNGLLEITGGYGVFGFLLYLSVLGLFVRNYLRMRTLVRDPWQRLANEWTFLCGVAVFLVEIADELIVLAFSIHAIWFWVIVGLQAGLRDAVGSNSSRPATPAPADGAVLQT